MELTNELPLTRIFNNAPSRILDFLLTNQRFDYSESDISKLANVPSRTLQRILPYLLKEHLVKRTRKSGKAFMYEINKDENKVKALLEYVKFTRDDVFKNSEQFQKPSLKQKSN